MALYGGRDSFRMAPDGDLSRGHSANSLNISFSNHDGSHLDLPRHVHPEGRTLDDYPAEYFIFQRPAVLAVRPARGRYLGAADFMSADIPKGADLILIKTGVPYESESYWRDNPGLDPGGAEFLKSLVPAPRCLGLDCISVNAWSDRGPGRAAHRILLAEPAILILEDLDLSPLDRPGLSLGQVTVAPLRLAGADGAPVTVLAELIASEEPARNPGAKSGEPRSAAAAQLKRKTK
jgi:kynurenine formamidase